MAPHVPAGADRVVFECGSVGICWPRGALAGSWRWQRLGRDAGLSHRTRAPTEAARGLWDCAGLHSVPFWIARWRGVPLGPFAAKPTPVRCPGKLEGCWASTCQNVCETAVKLSPGLCCWNKLSSTECPRSVRKLNMRVCACACQTDRVRQRQTDGIRNQGWCA